MKLAEWYIGGKLAHGMAMLPNYLTDLNAIHDVEKKLLFTHRQAYYTELRGICSRGLNHALYVDMSECIRATAEQKVEALLKALNLWENE